MSIPVCIRTVAWSLLAFALLAGSAHAQTPSVTLSASRVSPGTPVTLRARGLPQDASFELELRTPDGRTQVQELESGPSGALSAIIRPEQEGMWIVRLRGEGVHSIFGLAVTPSTTIEGEPARGPEPSAPDEATQTEAPGPTDEAAIEPDDDGAISDELEEPAGAAFDDDGAIENESEEPAGAELDDDGASEGPDAAEGDEPQAAEPRPDTFRIDGGDVVALRGDSTAWRLSFPPDSGPTGPLLETDATLWVPHGLWLLAVDPATGSVLERHAVPAPITSLTGEDGDLTATVTFETGVATDLTVTADGVRETVRFGTHPEAFGWLRNEADVEDPLARIAIDPTNPWLYVRAGEVLADVDPEIEEGTGLASTPAPLPPVDAREDDVASPARLSDVDAAAGASEAGSTRTRSAALPQTAREAYEEAVERGGTFFDLASIGAELYRRGESTLANRALDAAFRDWADRGYDPDLLRSVELRRAYGFPLVHLRDAVAAGDLEAADFWAPWAYRMAGGAVGPTREALRDYATLLRESGDRQGASLWSARAGELLRTRVGAVLDRAFLGLAGVGWLAVLALIVAAVLLYATLAAKYWRPQSLHLRQRREAGRTLRPWARTISIRFFSTTEKLVLVLLLVTALAMAGLATWDVNASLPDAAGSGTLASTPALAFVAGLDGDATRAAFVGGYAAHVAGDLDTARAGYEAAGAFAPAVNNLAAIEGEERLYQRALELMPGLPAARYNLGRITSPSPFHEAYRPGQPLLVTPSAPDLKIAAAGPWRGAIANAFVEPWNELRTTTPGMPVWLWTIVLVLFFLVIVAAIVALLIPRPRVARNAPRGMLYHALALLVPGAGLADELWGVLLLVPWSILGLDALLQWLGASSPLGLALDTTLWLLGAIYVVNLVGFVLELLSYRRRMRQLKKEQPELARRFGMRA